MSAVSRRCPSALLTPCSLFSATLDNSLGNPGNQAPASIDRLSTKLTALLKAQVIPINTGSSLDLAEHHRYLCLERQHCSRTTHCPEHPALQSLYQALRDFSNNSPCRRRGELCQRATISIKEGCFIFNQPRVRGTMETRGLLIQGQWKLLFYNNWENVIKLSWKPMVEEEEKTMQKRRSKSLSSTQLL